MIYLMVLLNIFLCNSYIYVELVEFICERFLLQLIAVYITIKEFILGTYGWAVASSMDV